MALEQKVRLTLAIGDYDVNQALLRGEVIPQGTEPVVLTLPSPQRHWRLMRHGEFDVCELSMASYLALRGRGELPYRAIPVFPHRRFRQSYLFVNNAAGITTPKDLEGKTVGLRTWQVTACVWVRGILQHEYGVDIKSIDWVTQDDEDVPLDPWPPRGFRVRRVPQGDNVDRMLADGEIVGLVYPELPPSLRKGDPRVGRLFGDAKSADVAYFRKTRIFPIMHTVVIREDLVEKYPWLPMELVQAFRTSKDLAFQRMEDPRTVSLAWLQEALEEQRAVLGPDPWSYDLPSNRHNVEALSCYAHEHGLTQRQLTVDELFYPSSVDDPPHYLA